MKNSFISGAIILMAANAVSKILGAVLKIPLTYIMHEEGMAVYNTAFSVYIMLLSFVISGVPFAVTKLSAGEIAKNNPQGAKSIVAFATVFLSVIGLAGSFVMWFGADFFALAMKEKHAAPAIRAIAPSVFFVALGAAAKSGFQGGGDMVPTAASQCIEAAVKLIAGFLLARYLIAFGTDMSAAGAAAGVMIGEFVATAILVIWYFAALRKTELSKNGIRKVFADTVNIALPALFMSVTNSAVSMVDTSVLRASLLRSGLTEDAARKLYGAYTGYAMTVLNLPSGFLATIGVSIIPVVSGAVAVGNTARVGSVARKGLFISSVCGLAMSVFIAVFGEWILYFLFKNVSSAPLLRLSAPSVLFVCVMQLSGAVLQSMGCMGKAFVSTLVSGIVRLIFARFLVSVPGINIYGAAIGSDAACFVGMVLNLIFLSCRLNVDKSDGLGI